MAFLNLLGAMIWFLLFPQGSVVVRAAMLALGAGIVLYFLSRVAFHLRRAKPELRLNPIS
jgi:hypothetical protein